MDWCCCCNVLIEKGVAIPLTFYLFLYSNMAITDATVNKYNNASKRISSDCNLETDTLKMALLTSSYTPSASHAVLADLTNEVSGNGYSRQTLGSVTLTQSSGTTTLDCADISFTASGGDIVARYWVIFDDTPTGDPLLLYGLLDDSPADITIVDGDTATYTINALGVLTLV